MLCAASVRVSLVVVGIVFFFFSFYLLKKKKKKFFTFPLNCFRLYDTIQAYLKPFIEKACFGKMTIFPQATGISLKVNEESKPQRWRMWKHGTHENTCRMGCSANSECEMAGNVKEQTEKDVNTQQVAGNLNALKSHIIHEPIIDLAGEWITDGPQTAVC